MADENPSFYLLTGGEGKTEKASVATTRPSQNINKITFLFELASIISMYSTYLTL